MTRHAVTGAAGALGRALVTSLRADGEDVLAVVRHAAQAPALADLGAVPVIADISAPGDWQRECATAQTLWHVAAPRLNPPVRGGTVRRRRRSAARIGARVAAVDVRTVVASSVLACDGGSSLGGVSAAAEAAFDPATTTIVRLGWPYHADAFLAFVVRGLRQSRFRIVGAGENRMPLIALEDAVTAMRTAAEAGPGTWTAFEPDVPTQRGLVEAICAASGARRPDRLPPPVAALSLGRALADALAADVDCTGPALAERGWSPRRGWREDLLSQVGAAPA